MWPIPISSIIVVVTAVGVGGMLLFFRPLVASTAWRATITPLASIMGSGFLVCAPLLFSNVGNYAVFAMAGLLCLAYAVGSVIRFNIRYGEQILETKGAPGKLKRDEHRLHIAHHNMAHRVEIGEAARFLEKTSHFALAGAYCVSVSYYLQLLASFALHNVSPDKPWFGKALVTLILVGIGATGAIRGLKGIERVERTVVGINLGMIASLLAGLIYHNIVFLSDGAWQLHTVALPSDKSHIIRLLMGMLIVVQGFETSRFLGSEHPREERIRTMRWAQLISSAIYIVFVAFITVVMNKTGAGGDTGITAIVGLSGAVAPILPLLITLTALGSQFSAATADDAGCSGLLESMFRSRIHSGFNYMIVSAAAIAITWVTNVYEIISYASRAFALYYCFQCVVAVLVVKRVPSVDSPKSRTMAYGFLALVCLAVTLFGIPAG